MKLFFLHGGGVLWDHLTLALELCIISDINVLADACLYGMRFVCCINASYSIYFILG